MASFEEQMEELERVVAQLEEGGLPLEENVTLFESGMRLSKACKMQLSAAESRVRVLLEPESGGEVRMEAVEVLVDGDDDDDEEDEGVDEGYEEE